jgi:hypothetical protein
VLWNAFIKKERTASKKVYVDRRTEQTRQSSQVRSSPGQFYDLWTEAELVLKNMTGVAASSPDLIYHLLGHFDLWRHRWKEHKAGIELSRLDSMSTLKGQQLKIFIFGFFYGSILCGVHISRLKPFQFFRICKVIQHFRWFPRCRLQRGKILKYSKFKVAIQWKVKPAVHITWFSRYCTFNGSNNQAKLKIWLWHWCLVIAFRGYRGI